jgi:hypothetical protein
LRRFPCTALALLLIPAALQASSTRRAWDFAPYSYLKRGPAEKGAVANDQPVQVSPAILGQALGSVRLVTRYGDEPLFEPHELIDLSEALSQALALAQPGEDLVLVSTAKRGSILLNNTLAVTARAFVRDGRLNLLVREARLDFMYKFALQNTMPEFDFGGRTAAGAAVLKAPGAELRRADWVVLPLAAAAQTPAPVEPAPAPAPLRVQAPAVAKPAGPAPAASAAEARLRELKRFREQGLITEDEYTLAKQDLLKAFTESATAGPGQK